MSDSIFSLPYATSRTNDAVRRRLLNIQRRLVAARQGVLNLREEGEHDLADTLQITIDRLNLEEIAWTQWQAEGYRSPTLDRLRKIRGELDEQASKRENGSPS